MIVVILLKIRKNNKREYEYENGVRNLDTRILKKPYNNLEAGNTRSHNDLVAFGRSVRIEKYVRDGRIFGILSRIN